MKPCPNCKGSGKLEAWDDSKRRIFRCECPTCKGIGPVHDGYDAAAVDALPNEDR